MTEAIFLEISPSETDGGELIGKRPEDVPSENLAQKFRAKIPWRPFGRVAWTAAVSSQVRFVSVWRLTAPRGRSAWAPIRFEPSGPYRPSRSTSWWSVWRRHKRLHQLRARPRVAHARNGRLGSGSLRSNRGIGAIRPSRAKSMR